MVEIRKAGRDAYVIVDDAGYPVASRGTADHAAEVWGMLKMNRRVPTEARQVVRDGLKVVLPPGSRTVVAERGRAAVKQFDNRDQARAWVKEYNRLRRAYWDLLDSSPYRYDFKFQLGRRYCWVILRSGVWIASFSGKTHALKFVKREAERDCFRT